MKYEIRRKLRQKEIRSCQKLLFIGQDILTTIDHFLWYYYFVELSGFRDVMASFEQVE